MNDPRFAFVRMQKKGMRVVKSLKSFFNLFCRARKGCCEVVVTRRVTESGDLSGQLASDSFLEWCDDAHVDEMDELMIIDGQWRDVWKSF